VAANPLVVIHEVQTAVGAARTRVSGQGSGLLVLGHGAGGGVDARDLLAAQDAALSLGWRVALVEQPWRVRGRRIAEAPPRLDRAWIDVLAGMHGRPLVVGGRSAGARVACRTSAEVGADAVLCLAFPLHPPGRPEKTRLPELAAVTVPLLVVQGSRDAFGVPDGAHLVPGADHGFKVSKGHEPAGPQVEAVVQAWLSGLGPSSN
jgi:predicted alpha/beta-hydrolase family hydrolase